MATERTVIARIRPLVVARDGYCRVARNPLAAMGPCWGVSEWAHLGESKRFKTRGQDPERRHTTKGTAMLCTGHHRDYDEHRLQIEELTPERANGRLGFVRDGRRFEE